MYAGGMLGVWMGDAGVELRPGYVRWYSRALNPLLGRIGRTFALPLRLWYSDSHCCTGSQHSALC